jgi:hypothetical protein
LRNPTGFIYTNEAVRLHLPVPPEPFAVKQDGVSVPYQVETVDGKPFAWVSVAMGKNARPAFTIEPGERATGKPRVTVRRAGDSWEMDNGLIAVRVPSGPVRPIGQLGPIARIRLPNGEWVGEGFWHTERKLTDFAAAVVGDGTVFAKIRLRYEFEGMAGIEGKTPAFAQVDVALHPGQRHLVIEESHEMGRNDAWEFDLCRGWKARTPILEVFDGGAGRPKRTGPLLTDLQPLGWTPEALQSRYDLGDPRLGDTLMWLVPKQNQHYEDGWLFAVTDGVLAAGAIPCLPGQWVWPHDNKIAVSAKETADYAGLRCPTRRGARFWCLLVGTPEDFSVSAASGYVLDRVYRGLDRLLIEYITDWPGQDGNGGFYAGSFNPLVRAFKLKTTGGDSGGGPMDALAAAQVALGPDMQGDQWRFWSTENPNFFSGYVNGVLGSVRRLQEHPRYEELRRWAAQRVAEDVYFAITLPSGAGQECPGYQKRGFGELKWCEGLPMAGDMKARSEAGPRFQRRITWPDGASRRASPMGDSHPRRDPKGELGMMRVSVPAEEVQGWRTEELHGYGVVFTHRPGTPMETYLAFKSGPNRGHFHGDQLAFHYCANARPVAVDHHCSYNPRAGQEHMHNRVAFFTDDMPWANMDGYERLIAFKTSGDADIAVGQVESERLRFMQRYPPEDWDRDFPQIPFSSPLAYRRTVVMVKAPDGADAGAPAEDYFVLRDQYRADRPLGAAYCLHVNAPGTLALEVNEEGGGEADGQTAAFTDPRFDFGRAKLPLGCTLVLDRIGGETRHAITSAAQRVAYLRDIPAKGKGIPYRVVDGEGKPLVARPARYATVGADGAFRDPQVDFVKAGVQAGWQVLAQADGRDRCMVVRAVEENALKCEPVPPSGHYTRYRVLKCAVAMREGRVVFDRLTLYCAQPARARFVPFPWTHANGGLEETQGIRLEMEGRTGEFVTVLYPGTNAPAFSALPGGVRVGGDEIRFAGGLDEDRDVTYVTVVRGGKTVAALSGDEMDLNRFQGDVGLWVPNTGYPFGEIPDWLIRQRIRPPAWYDPVIPLGYRQKDGLSSGVP